MKKIGKFLLGIYFFVILIVKFIFQAIEFYLIIIITNIIIGYNIIFICSFIYLKEYLVLSLIFSIVFSYISANLLTIYYYEFSKLSWINHDAIVYSVSPYISRQLDDKKKEFATICNNDYWIILFFIIRFLYFEPLKDTPEIFYIFFLVLYPVFKIFNIFYVVLKNKEIVMVLDCEFPFFKFKTFEIGRNNEIKAMKEDSWKKFLLNILLLLTSFVYHLIILSKKKESIIGYPFVIFIYFACMPFFLFLKIDPLFISFKEGKNKNDNKKVNKNIKRCKMIVIILFSIINIFLIKQIYNIFSNSSGKKHTIQAIFNKTNNFTGYHWKDKTNKTITNILSPVCYTKIHHLNFIQLTSLANAAYLKDEINSEQNIIKAFKSSIFSQIDNNTELVNITFLTNYSDLVTILKTDFFIQNEKPLTVISFKGSSTPFDFLLDIEMFISSAFFSVARKIPLLFKSETFASYIFTYLCLLPFKFLENLALTKIYMNQIDNIFKELIKQPGYDLKERDYVFVGHSLGGGLAKLTGFKNNLQSFSVSGPGFSPLEFFFGAGKKSMINILNQLL